MTSENTILAWDDKMLDESEGRMWENWNCQFDWLGKTGIANLIKNNLNVTTNLKISRHSHYDSLPALQWMSGRYTYCSTPEATT
jgi:hypothetical protein